ncbi:MAG: hypothetical protein AAF125_02485, partial [Chloroflexota bacterium]
MLIRLTMRLGLALMPLLIGGVIAAAPVGSGNSLHALVYDGVLPGGKDAFFVRDIRYDVHASLMNPAYIQGDAGLAIP